MRGSDGSGRDERPWPAGLDPADVRDTLKGDGSGFTDEGKDRMLAWLAQRIVYMEAVVSAVVHELVGLGVPSDRLQKGINQILERHERERAEWAPLVGEMARRRS